MTKIRLGISTCPNDTFAFHALIEGLVDRRGMEFEVELLDIQQLNDGLFAGRFDVAKCSFHAALLLSESMVVLPSGSALGFGVGPLLLAADSRTTPEREEQLTLCPGAHTTAALLFRMFYPNTTRIEHVVFSEIMPRLSDRSADFGVCIHEGRFTWQDQGLSLVEDLGVRWEHETRGPLPLGGLVGARSLGPETLATISAVIRDSIEWSLGNPDAALVTMRQHAQEFDDEVLMKHVELYVNDWTVDLGEVGRAALEKLNEQAIRSGILSAGNAGLEVFRQQ